MEDNLRSSYALHIIHIHTHALIFHLTDPILRISFGLSVQFIRRTCYHIGKGNPLDCPCSSSGGGAGLGKKAI